MAVKHTAASILTTGSKGPSYRERDGIRTVVRHKMEPEEGLKPKWLQTLSPTAGGAYPVHLYSYLYIYIYIYMYIYISEQRACWSEPAY